MQHAGLLDAEENNLQDALGGAIVQGACGGLADLVEGRFIDSGDEEEEDEEADGGAWKRHHQMDPSSLRLALEGVDSRGNRYYSFPPASVLSQPSRDTFFFAEAIKEAAISKVLELS